VLLTGPAPRSGRESSSLRQDQFIELDSGLLRRYASNCPRAVSWPTRSSASHRASAWRSDPLRESVGLKLPIRAEWSVRTLVPRGGLHQWCDINDLGKGGSTDHSTRSLRFPGKVSHQRADFPACAQIRRGPLAGQWSRRAAPGVLAILKIMLSSSGVVASDTPRPYKPAARFGTISRTLRIVAAQFRISLHSVRDPPDAVGPL